MAHHDNTGGPHREDPSSGAHGAAGARSRASEAWFRALVDSIPQIAFIAGRDGLLEFFNDRAAQYTGLTTEVLRGAGWRHAAHPDEVDRLAALWWQARRDGTVFEAEMRIRTPDGGYRWNLARSVPVADPETGELRWIGTCTDVDDLKRAEAAARASEELARRRLDELERVYQATPVGLADMDLGLRFVRVNERLAAINGRPVAEHIGRRLREVVPGLAHILEPAYREVMETRKAVPDLDVRGSTPSAPGEDRNWTANLYPVFGPQGEVAGMSAVVVDVTERTRAREALERYSRRLENLRSIYRAMQTACSPGEIAGAALGQLTRLVPCTACRIEVFDLAAAEAITLAALGGTADGAGGRAPLEQTGEADLAALWEGRGHVVADLAALVEVPPAVRVPMGDGARSYARVPLGVGGQTIGALSLFSDRPAAFSADDLEAACEVADQLAVAIRQARLFEEVRAGRERLRALSRQLLGAQEAERRHIARELHDEVGQALTAIKFHLVGAMQATGVGEARPLIEGGIDLAERTIRQVRSLSLDLRPTLLDDLGLAAALRSFAQRQAGLTGLDVRVVADLPEPRPRPELETACFRVAQEAITNVVRHARASSVRVELRREGGALRLLVVDDGVGFSVGEARARAARGSSVGLLGMEERVTLLGGRFRVDSRPGHGTELEATFREDPDDGGCRG